MIELKNLWVRYPNQNNYTLRDINLEIRRRGLYLVVGKTGCGKTTLARTIVGIIPHIFYADVMGRVDVLGEDPLTNGPEVLVGKVAYVAQNPELFVTSISVEEELFLPLVNMGLEPEDIVKRVKSVVEALRLEDLFNSSTLTLSSGQLQLVALATAIATGAEILILDEPLSRLDPDNYIRFIKILETISDKRTVLVFEHHLDYIVGVADEIIVMDRGSIVARGDLDDVAEFLIDINIPDFLEYAIILRRMGCLDRIPRTLDEFIAMIKNAAEHKKCLV